MAQVIEASLRERLRGLGGFRNILVHDYLRLEARRIEDFITRAPGDFSDFAVAVRAWLERTVK